MCILFRNSEQKEPCTNPPCTTSQAHSKLSPTRVREEKKTHTRTPKVRCYSIITGKGREMSRSTASTAMDKHHALRRRTRVCLGSNSPTRARKREREKSRSTSESAAQKNVPTGTHTPKTYTLTHSRYFQMSRSCAQLTTSIA